jgi:hypothetical protein
MFIDAIFYILAFGAIIYYLINWTKNNAKLREYIIAEKAKIRKNWSKYTASGPFSDALLTEKEGFGNIVTPANRANCSGWDLVNDKSTNLGYYNDTETNEYSPLDTHIAGIVDGGNIDPQLVAKAKADKYKRITTEQTKIYLDKVNAYLDTPGPENTPKITNKVPFTLNSKPTSLFLSLASQQAKREQILGDGREFLGTASNRTLFLADIPEFVTITPNINNPGAPVSTILTSWANNPDASAELVSPGGLAKYQVHPWVRIYKQILVYKADFASNVEYQYSLADEYAFSKTYPQLNNIEYALDKLNAPDPIQGSSYYPADRVYLNAEARRRFKLVQDLDRQVLSSEDYTAKWGWVDKVGEKLKLPAQFGINDSPDVIRDAQSRSVMDILTDYDPGQFGCQRIYQECSTRQAPGFQLDAFDYNKYNSYLDKINASRPDGYDFSQPTSPAHFV